MKAKVLVTLGLPAMALATTVEPAGAQLDAGEMITTVSDSGSYSVYSYTLVNAGTSTWGLAAVLLDLEATSGTPENLTSTGGALRDFTTTGVGQVPHAEVGTITPSTWKAIFDRTATLMWSAGMKIRTTNDSISPGDSLQGFGIRSSYLPGLTTVTYLPTLESCCKEPSDTIEGTPYWSGPQAFAVQGMTIAPRYSPEEIDLDVLQSQLTAICSDPLWLDDPSLCTELGGLLDDAATEETAGNYYGAVSTAEHLLARITTEQSAFQPNGYWLMAMNVAQVRENLLAAAKAFPRVEATGPR